MTIERVVVVGGGIMGSGIAQTVATSGQSVCLVDVSDEVLNKALKGIKWSLDKLAEKEALNENPDVILKRIGTASDMNRAAGNADLVIEAVFEDINLKRSIFEQLDRAAPKNAILATNTSGLSVTFIAEATRRQERVIGMHWMNPAPLSRLIEVIVGRNTSEETQTAILDLCKRYRREVVLAKKDVWFFLVTRAHVALGTEAASMYLRKEADFKEIDATIKYRLGQPLGEFELADFGGRADIRTRAVRSIEEILKTHPEFEPWPAFLESYRYQVRELWEPMRQKGLVGVKSGQGFYTYPGGKYVKPDISESLANRVDPVQLLATPVNAAAWCVAHGVGSVDDLNKSFRLAYGWKKGIFELAEEYGLDRINAALDEKQERAPGFLKDFYRIAPMLREGRIQS